MIIPEYDEEEEETEKSGVRIDSPKNSIKKGVCDFLFLGKVVAGVK